MICFLLCQRLKLLFSPSCRHNVVIRTTRPNRLAVKKKKYNVRMQCVRSLVITMVGVKTKTGKIKFVFDEKTKKKKIERRKQDGRTRPCIAQLYLTEKSARVFLRRGRLAEEKSPPRFSQSRTFLTVALALFSALFISAPRPRKKRDPPAPSIAPRCRCEFRRTLKKKKLSKKPKKTENARGPR